VTTFPLPTLACTVTSTGITSPSLSDILTSLQTSYALIYGSDVDLDPDAQDGQWLGIQAQAQYDSNQAQIATYNQYSPATAVGTGLSSVVKINGIARLVPSNSTAPILIVGQAGTGIVDGLVGDSLNLGTQWALPASVTIPPGGEITVTATCTTLGAVTVPSGYINKILTPTAGWQTAASVADAAPGAPVEADGTLRERQARSTDLPAQTVAQAIAGNLLNLTGVTAVSYDDNSSGATDGNGVPAHSIAFVVEGGDTQAIVNVIGSKKSPGAGTYGSISGTYVNSAGIPTTISYTEPSQVRVVCAVTLTALTGYTSVVGNEITAALVAYVASLGIGTNVIRTRLFAPALLSGTYATPESPTDALTYELTDVKIAVYPTTPGDADVTITYDQIAGLATADVVITVS
jgi:uncharacterized phage protein gp47/JayE